MASPSVVFLTLGFVLTTTCLAVSNVMVTPPPDLPKWTVRDDNNNICMLMAMNATLKGSSRQNYPVPQTARAKPVSGSCRDDLAYFSLSWSFFTINILFNKNGGTYKMDEVNGTEESGFSFSSWSEQSSSFPSAAVGHSMTCDDVKVGHLNFTTYQFQPFAQLSGGEFGQGEQCSDGVLTIVIILVVMSVLIVGSAIAVVVFLVLRRQRRTVYSSL